MRDKPRIDRDRVRRDEHRARRVLRIVRDITRLLSPGEELCRPVRQGDQIVVDVIRGRESAAMVGSDVETLSEASF